uniref:Transglutaminase-like domain-containing protein n=1 Tax=Ciona savignyi TaxID=51511 RepID=H2YW71_CIOSA
MVNCNDDTGVLWGRWDGEYSDGVRPTVWKGSVKILKEWNTTKMMPVKYGQCWVFSGLLTTVLRAIGIPARSVTNFNSAHDTEYNMTIDKFIDKNGDEARSLSGDSIWNFHVWNECYFRRADLPEPIEPGETYTSPDIEVRPYRVNRTVLIADFDCNEIWNIKARKRVNVVQ